MLVLSSCLHVCVPPDALSMDLASTTRQFEYLTAVSGRRIRLLHLSPGSGSEQLCLYLSEFDLEQSPPFTALSYAWGDPQDKKTRLVS